MPSPVTAAPPRSTPPGPPVTAPLVPVCRLTWVVAALLAVTSLAGLLFGGRGLYQDDPMLLPQFYGQDALSLVVALPLLVGSMRSAHRGSVRGLLLWSGMLFYVVYWYYFYVAGIRFGPLFLVHVALVSAALFALLALLARVDVDAVRRRFSPETPVRWIGGVLVGVGLLFIAFWIGDVVRRLAAGEPLDAVSRGVYAIDLVLMLPLTVAVGIALWRRIAWGYALAGLVLVKVVATTLLLVVNSVLVVAWGEPVDPGQAAAYAATAAVALAFTGVYMRAIRQP